MKNNSEWLKVVGAAVFEVMWVIGLKHASTMWEWLITVVAIIISFYVMISASTKLPVGTVYSVFVGLGTARYSSCGHGFIRRTVQVDEAGSSGYFAGRRYRIENGD